MKDKTQRRQRTRSKPLWIWITCCSLCSYNYSYAAPCNGDQALLIADRAMLEFLADFDAMDDAEFDLLAAYAEQDAAREGRTDSELSPELQTDTDGKNE